MTAAIYAARKKMDAVALSPQIGGQAVWASEVENYLGYRLISGMDLVEKFESHVKDLGMRVVEAAVRSLRVDGRAFAVETESGESYEARAVIVASGRSSRPLGAAGEEEFKGRGVTYCATCDAPLFAGEDVAVVGTGNAGLDAAIQLFKYARQVTIVEMLDHLTADESLQDRVRARPNGTIMLRTRIVEILGDKFVTGIRIRNLDTGEESVLPVTGVFVEIGSLPNVGFLPPELKLNKWNEIEIDCACATNIPGLFAAGDVTSVPEKQIVIAAGDGAKALLSAHDYLVRNFPA